MNNKKGFLVVTLRLDDAVEIGNNLVTLKLIKVKGKQIRLGFHSDKDLRIERRPREGEYATKNNNNTSLPEKNW